MGPDLLETLEVYLDSGQNMREAGRRLHLAPRTVAYRLDRIASLLGHPLDASADGCPVAAFAKHAPGRRLRRLGTRTAAPDLADIMQEFGRQIGRIGACQTAVREAMIGVVTRSLWPVDRGAPGAPPASVRPPTGACRQ
jgi:hypothetical protein